jgi:hypothetical protein
MADEIKGVSDEQAIITVSIDPGSGTVLEGARADNHE